MTESKSSPQMSVTQLPSLELDSALSWINERSSQIYFGIRLWAQPPFSGYWVQWLCTPPATASCCPLLVSLRQGQQTQRSYGEPGGRRGPVSPLSSTSDDPVFLPSLFPLVATLPWNAFA